ncbi:MAG TPA: fibronectin type III domain-containing protein [Candidatus Bathyarchaeia archaeon]|nr:fibronectin type III domain-containing protein [Candidatus Bathyarchaeia archaeon]
MAHRSITSGAGVMVILAMLCVLARCSSEKNPAEPKPVLDKTPPADVTDLAAHTVTATSMMLTWTAPGDDGMVGTAERYDIRFSVDWIGTATWVTASRASNVPLPRQAGRADTFVVTGLSPGTGYYFALKTADKVPNWSALSNIVRRMTAVLPDTVPPAAVTDLAVSHRGARTAVLCWTAPGNDGVTGIAASYDIRYSTFPITADAWSSAMQTTGEPAPQPPGTREEFVVRALAPNKEYYFALKTADERLNTSALSNVASVRTLPCTNCWLPLASGVGESGGQSPYVSSLAVFDGRLIAAGSFDSAGDVPAHNIAAWDGDSWAPLGLGLDGPVNALAVYRGQLVAGRTPNPSSPAPVYAWNGTSWSPLAGLNDAVLALSLYDGELIAGGAFSEAEGVAANAVAAWDGNHWYGLGSGLGGGNDPAGCVYALGSCDDRLIAAGSFTSAGGFQAGNIASWNGLSWTPLPKIAGGPAPVVRALAFYKLQLVAGGFFSTAGGAPSDDIAGWDGSSWTPLGQGLGGETSPKVGALIVYGGLLVAGGNFTAAGGAAAGNAAMWDGSAWASMGPGVSGGPGRGILTFVAYNGQLVAGGDFRAASGDSARCIALWANE